MLKVTAGEYSIKSSEFECSLNNVYRKENGIFYTDLKLSKLILEHLNISTDRIILDPCCGAGSFLFAALEKGCKKVYGADLDSGAVKFCRKFTDLGQAVKKLDTLGNDGEKILKSLKLNKKADYVVGNPPYCPLSKNIIVNAVDYSFWRKVRDFGNNLFVAAILRAFELTDTEGVTAYIIPKNFLHVRTYSMLRKFLLNEKTIISITDLGAYFPNVRGEQILLVTNNKFTPDNRINFFKFFGDSFEKLCDVEQKFYSDEILIFESCEEYSIYRIMEKTYMKFSDICTGYVGRGKSKSPNAIFGKDIRKFGFKNCTVPEKGNHVFIQNIYSAESGIIASFAGNDFEAAQTVTVFTDGDEKMCRYIVGILHSRLCNFYLLKFCYNNSKLTMHTDAKYLHKLPLKNNNEVLFNQLVNLVKVIENVEYMSEIWFEMFEELNELVYKIYGISQSEKNFIDNEMRSIQSERWKNDK